MHDAPSKERILVDVARFLKQDVLPATTDRALAFRVRIAAHLLATVAREVDGLEEALGAELADLEGLGLAAPTGSLSEDDAAVRAGREALAARIRDGADDADDVLIASLRRRLAVGQPHFSLDIETGEDEWTS